ncbi:uncharacterized protein LOC114961168 [Acropora millepora]|uniref:uncharacterized protein LOC114961168 n=1 Tax=Acropora millepora TaxID=45264 RepID=UPI001CF1AA02|nr:uncharacterized protein LOC114961168 [Acropora millepora]
MAGEEVIARDKRLSMKVTDIPLRVYSDVCVMLNVKREPRCNDFRMLAEKVGLSRNETAVIEQTSSSPADKILQNWSVKKEATVGNLIKLLKEESFDREDVVLKLEDWVNKP